ncbi:MAG: hypothetical protein KGY48_00350 [Wenzhouxiangellaceae bacterium]|nr:hypothetical protein [Wenzhouxiangellaceae bacterium]MBS3745681.1 hypothetical protein [Wenzhouxiangellaceae bacterium]
MKPGHSAAANRRRTGRTRLLALAVTSVLACGAAVADTPPDTEEILDRLEALEARQKELERELAEREARIRELEGDAVAEDRSPAEQRREAPAGLADGSGEPETEIAADTNTGGPRTPPAVDPAPDRDSYGVFQPGGQGFKLVDTPQGDLNFSAWAYVRYLNQQDLDDTYVDAFGREREINQRNDFQLNKINLYFKGWVFDPALRYTFYTWTSNASQGESASVVIAGNMSYRFSRALDLGVGIGGLPGTRTLRGTFPYWNKVDHRTIADEFFRPSYTSGIWASGALENNLNYRVMVGNNLSQVGVSADQLDDGLNTWSGALWWTPQGDYGPAGGYGDFEFHESPATTFGIHLTRSREDRQSQPGTEDIENAQIRLSDGTLLFQPGAFGTAGRVNRATYLMSAVDAGYKYRGWSLEGEYYWRWVDDFATVGDVPVDDLFDHGFQLQLGSMLVPKKLQAYVAGSQIFGEYGNPWDLSGGLNWYPNERRLFRVNSELMYLNDSPVGYSSVPFVLGGNGFVFHTNLEMMF